MQFIDLAAQQTRLKPDLDRRLAAVLAHGQYVMGPEVRELETRLSAFCGARHTLACANGTDALLLALMAFGVRGGEVVFCPSFTFAATAEVVPCMGAVPVFVDVDPVTFNMDPLSLARAIDHAKTLGMRPSGVIAVDLFGLPADYAAIEAIAAEHGLWLIADSAQGFGASYQGRTTGSIGRITTTSFFPAKPLGCYGDGGAVFTDDDTLAALIDSYRIHGKGHDKYDNVRIGMNSRLDTLQAAVLLAKLDIYAEEIALRQTVAARYADMLAGAVETPVVPEGYRSVWAQYTVKLPEGTDRAQVQAALKDAGIPSAIYYPIPLHRQTAYRAFPHDPAGMAVTDHVAGRVLSLPMHPYLGADDQARVAEMLRRAVQAAPCAALAEPA